MLRHRAPAAARVRVGQILSRGRGSRKGDRRRRCQVAFGSRPGRSGLGTPAQKRRRRPQEALLSGEQSIGNISERTMTTQRRVIYLMGLAMTAMLRGRARRRHRPAHGDRSVRTPAPCAQRRLDPAVTTTGSPTTAPTMAGTTAASTRSNRQRETLRSPGSMFPAARRAACSRCRWSPTACSTTPARTAACLRSMAPPVR